MNEAVPVHLTECRCQANSNTQEATQIEWLSLVPLKDLIQRFTARILKYKNGSSIVASDRQRLGCPGGIKFACQRVLMLEPS
jgi:hypothetical protein